MTSRLTQITAATILLYLSVYFLVIGKPILLPLVCAIALWFITLMLMGFLKKISQPLIKIPDAVLLIATLFIFFTSLYELGVLLGYSFNNILNDAPKYQEKINVLFAWITQKTNHKVEMNTLLSTINLPSIISDFAYALTTLASNVFIILLYLLFIFVEYKSFNYKLKAICGTEEKFHKLEKVLMKIQTDLYAYINIKTVMSLLTGAASFFVLWGFQVSNAFFWAFLIFILNYIPTIGSAIALGLTIIAISVQFNAATSLLSVGFLLVFIQFIVGNLIETRYMGRHLDLSPLVILLSLAFWGSIWGWIGLFLSVPMMTMLAIILSQFKETRFFAILLSSGHKISEK